MSASRNIVSFVGQNENGILRQMSHDLMSLLEPDGFKGHVIDLHKPDWQVQFNDLLREGIFMAWGHAGIGAGLQIDGQLLWDAQKIPFVSVLADSPCWRVPNHYIRSRYVANAYVFSEWLSIQNRFIRSPQYSTQIKSVGVIPNPQRDSLAWRDRPQRMAFVKTGGDPEARRKGWQNLPSRWRAVLEDAGRVAIQQPTGDITDIYVAACESHNLPTEHRLEIFFTLMFDLDLYVREYRMNTLVKSLLDLPVDIYGRGWDHLSSQATQARFHPAFDAAHLSSVYAGTQFLLNTSPNVGSGLHERVAFGLDSRCVVVSDYNAFSRKNLSDLPSFYGFDTTDPTLKDQMHGLYYSKTDYTETTQAAVDYIAENFGGKSHMVSVLKIAEELKIAEGFLGNIPPSLAFA
ncbi:MAG: hypothetical protein ABF535_02405 [Acetobacter sp.]